MKILIPVIPVDNEKNREHARRLGQEWITWPTPPPGSVQMKCENCAGAVQVDAESQTIRQALINDGVVSAVVCILCAATISRRHESGAC